MRLPELPREATETERFISVEALSGLVLLGAALIALGWANSSAAEQYHSLWAIRWPSILMRDAHPTLRFWVNDGLMTLFFLVVGLELRREFHRGELSRLDTAILPMIAAIGGIAAPAVIYLLLNRDPVTRVGWAIPTATDIAFAVGTLAMLGSRVSRSMRVLLLAIAIADDVVAIVIIAVFYGSPLHPLGIALAAGAVALVLAQQRWRMRQPLVYVPAAILLWLGLLWAGFHPALTGVILGLLTPLALQQPRSRAPTEQLESRLHSWVAFTVMPLFAFANAGVTIRGVNLDEANGRIFAGVTAALVLGKPIGILLATAAAMRLRIVRRPDGVSYRQLGVIAILAGIGFTVSMFMGDLAFGASPLLAAAKLGILAASLTAGALGLIVGRIVLKPLRP